MKTVRVLHTADWHIGATQSYLLEKGEARKYETLATAGQVIELCNAQSVDLMLIAGDLFDSNRVSDELVEKVFSLFNQLYSTKVVIALGNHDPLTADSPFKRMSLPENVIVLPTTDSVINLEDLGCRVYGASFDGVYKLGASRFGITPPDDDIVNIMVLHGETRTDLSSTYNSITRDFIAASKMDYIALGHIHKRSEIYQIGNTFFSYCGCIEGQGFDETGEKGVYLGEIGKGSAMLDFYPTQRRIHHSLSVDISGGENTVSRIREAISGASKRPADDLFRITLTGELPEGKEINLSELSAEVSPYVYFLRLKDKTKTSVDLELLSREQSVKGYFVKRMLEKISTANENEKATYENALMLGLKAFSGEVSYNED